MKELLQLLINGSVTGSILALAAVGISLVYGVLKLVNFAAGDYLTFGAYTAFVFNYTLKLPLFLSILVSMVAVSLLGIILDLAVWRQLRKNKAGQLAHFLTAIGIAFILRQAISFGFGADNKQYRIDLTKVYRFSGVYISYAQVIVLSCSIGGVILFALFLARTNLGKQMRAYSDNPTLASVSGVNVEKIVIIVWIINGLLGAMAGVFQGLTQASFTVDMGWQLQLSIFAAVVLGSIGSAYGALIGGFLLGVLMELSTWSGFHGGLAGGYKPIVAFFVLVFVLLFRPQGIFGHQSRSI